MEDNKNQNPGIQIELRPEVAKGVYANLALITHSSSDFVLDFASILPGLPKPEINSRVIMAPEHAKRTELSSLAAIFGNLGCVDNQASQIRAAAMEMNASKRTSSLS